MQVKIIAEIVSVRVGDLTDYCSDYAPNLTVIERF